MINNHEPERTHEHHHRHRRSFWYKYRYAWDMHEQRSRQNVLIIALLLVLTYLLVIAAVHVVGGYLNYKEPVPETRGDLSERFASFPTIGYNSEE